MRRGLAKLGEPSTLQGVDCGRVALEREVDLFAGIESTSEDNPVVRYVVAAIDVAYSPRVGQSLAHPDGTYLLDRLVSDNGTVQRFIVVPDRRP